MFYLASIISQITKFATNQIGIISFLINAVVYFIIICIITHYLAKLYVHSRKPFDRERIGQKVKNSIGMVYTVEILLALVIEVFRFRQGYSFVGDIIKLFTSKISYITIGNMIIYWLIIKGALMLKNSQYQRHHSGKSWQAFHTSPRNNQRIYHIIEIAGAILLCLIGLGLHIGILNLFS